MEIVTGPVLYFRGMEAGHCRIGALVVLPKNHRPALLYPGVGEPVSARQLGRGPGLTAWGYDFQLPAGQPGHYTIGARSWSVHPPGGGPLRIAYTACNGSERDRPGPVAPERNERWRHLARQHEHTPYQLLIQGGDQVYADALWKEVSQLHRWCRLSWRRQLQADFTPAMAREVGDFYFRHYCWLWSQPDLAPLLASIPSLMMWDDHDIFDGWG
ncbi:MAG: alkaline phosphatase family protein, partial [Candidatus Competibacteraceae bacterium]|nr:alkaline phosphatase family protein [Candidatus Competibacteraceae bacterium]